MVSLFSTDKQNPQFQYREHFNIDSLNKLMSQCPKDTLLSTPYFLTFFKTRSMKYVQKS